MNTITNAKSSEFGTNIDNKAFSYDINTLT